MSHFSKNTHKGDQPSRALLEHLSILLSSAALASMAICSCNADSSFHSLPFEPAGPNAAPDPATGGPFPVGVTTFDLFDRARKDDTGEFRHVPVEVFYPAVQDARDDEYWTYDFAAEAKEQDLGDAYEKIVEAGIPGMRTEAVRDAEIDRGHGPYPVIVFSHGAYGIRWQSVSLTVHLASHGFIVAAPDHEGNTVWDLIRDGYSESANMESAAYRIDDVKFVVDWLMERGGSSDDLLGGMIDIRHIGVAGHSFGGFTAFTAGCLDQRLKVVLAQSPILKASIAWGCDISNYPADLMVMGGTMDQTVPFRDQYCEYREVSAQTKFLCQIQGAGHYTFSDICTLDLARLSTELEFGPAQEALADGCSPENIDWSTAATIIDYYSTALFNWKLRESPGSKAFLSPKNDPVFEAAQFFIGNPPDWPDGGCSD